MTPDDSAEPLSDDAYLERIDDRINWRLTHCNLPVADLKYLVNTVRALTARVTELEGRLKFAIPVPEGFVAELSDLLDEDDAMDVHLLIEKYGVPAAAAEHRIEELTAERDAAVGERERYARMLEAWDCDEDELEEKWAGECRVTSEYMRCVFHCHLEKGHEGRHEGDTAGMIWTGESDNPRSVVANRPKDDRLTAAESQVAALSAQVEAYRGLETAARELVEHIEAECDSSNEGWRSGDYDTIKIYVDQHLFAELVHLRAALSNKEETNDN